MDKAGDFASQQLFSIQQLMNCVTHKKNNTNKQFKQIIGVDGMHCGFRVLNLFICLWL